MTLATISVIVGVVGFLFWGWLRSKQAQVDVIEDKNEALEKAAEKERQEDAAEDEAEATEIVNANDRGRAIRFLRDSFDKGSDKVRPAPVADNP